MIPDITRSVDWDFLHSFSTINLQVSYPFEKEPYRLECHPVNKTRIDSVRVWVTNGRNNILDLNEVDIALSLIIEEEEFHPSCIEDESPKRVGEIFRRTRWSLSLQAQRFGTGSGYSHGDWKDVKKRRDKCGKKSCTKLR